MTYRELLEKALEALELLARCEHPLTKIQVRKPRDGGSIVTVYPHQVATDAAEPLRERLAQPEPVIDKSAATRIATALGWEPRREWVGLTEEDFSAINQSCLTKLQAATSAESILKEKNNG